MQDFNHFILVLILPGDKPQLLWAVELNMGSKKRSLINYYVPTYNEGFRFKIVYKLYRYPDNIKQTFTINNNMTEDREQEYNEFNNYITTNNMVEPKFVKEVNIIQDKGSNLGQLFNGFFT